MERFTLLVLIVFLTFTLVTCMLYYFYNNKKLIKYLPSLIGLIGASFYFAASKKSYSDSFKDLVYAAASILLFIGFISGLLTALYLDFIWPKIKKKH